MAPVATVFAGSLPPKTKGDLLELGQALGLNKLDGHSKNDMLETIQKHLDENEEKLRKDDRFKGLYIRRKRGAANGASPDSEAEADSTPRTARQAAKAAADSAKPVVDNAYEQGKTLVHRGLKRAKEAGLDPAEVPLPDSVRSLKQTANHAIEAVEPTAQAVQKKVNEVSRQTIRAWQRTGKREVAQALHRSQEVLSNSKTIISVMLFLELLALLITVIPQTEYEVQFPPSQFSTGHLGKLGYQLFKWAPEIKAKFKLPSSMFSITPGTEVFGDLAVWTATTVLPPFILAHLISYVPQTYSGARQTRASNATIPWPSPDPLVFALTRLAILLLPLTSAAPDLWRFSLEKMGSTSGRALAGGVTAALVLADRITQ